MPAAGKTALAEAKADFQCVRSGKQPRYARCETSSNHHETKSYQGRGYRLTVVHDSTFYAHSDGPLIVLEPSLTGGKAYRYAEVDEISD